MDRMVKFGEKAVAFVGKLPIAQTCENPSLFLRKHGIVTLEDVYLLMLIDVDIANLEKNEALYLQWLVQDVRLPSGLPFVGNFSVTQYSSASCSLSILTFTDTLHYDLYIFQIMKESFLDIFKAIQMQKGYCNEFM